MEIWKDIKGYEGLYQVSNKGKIKSLKRKWYSTTRKGNKKECSSHEKILKTCDNGNGYLVVNLSKNNKVKMFTVHKLVAKEFLENPLNKTQINHIDENKQNNKVENLEWATPSENINHGNRNKKHSKKMSLEINQYTKDGKFIKTWLGMREIERVLGIKNQSICQCCKGKIKTSGGFVWKYNNKELIK